MPWLTSIKLTKYSLPLPSICQADPCLAMRGPPLSPVQESDPPNPLAHIWLWENGIRVTDMPFYVACLSGTCPAIQLQVAYTQPCTVSPTPPPSPTPARKSDSDCGGETLSPGVWVILQNIPQVIKPHLEDAWPLLSLSSAPASHHQLLSSITRICQAYWPESVIWSIFVNSSHYRYYFQTGRF